MTRFMGGAGRRERWVTGVVGSLLGLALGAVMLADSVGAQATAAPNQDPRYKNVSCANGGRAASADFFDDIGNVHQLWYENFGFRTGNPKDPGGWYEMGQSPASSELPRDHRVSGSFDDDAHSLNGNQHATQEDLDHAHAFNMVRGLLNICLNSEG